MGNLTGNIFRKTLWDATLRNPTIDGGSVNGATLGASTPAAGAVTTLKVTTGAGDGKMLVSDASGNMTPTTSTGTGAPVRATSPTLVTPALGTPASGNLGNCTAYPTASTAEALAGTDTAKIITPATRAAASAVETNPKALSQAIHMTAATSDSNGIQVANNANINFGTGDFTLVWRGSLPNWQATESQYFLRKREASNAVFEFACYQSGRLYFLVNGVYCQLGVAELLTLAANTTAEICVVINRAAATVQFYLNGVAHFGPVAITPSDVSNTGVFTVAGTTAARTAATTQAAYTFNRALTAAEVLDLYRNGVSFADKWGSQAELSSGAWQNTSGVQFSTFASTGPDQFQGESATSTGNLRVQVSAPTNVGKRYYMEFTPTFADITLTQISLANSNYGNAGAIVSSPSISSGSKYSITFDSPGIRAQPNIMFMFEATAGGSFEVADFSIKQIGATLSLEPEGIQPAPGQWIDSSSNKLHGLQPAEGSSLVRPQRTFEIRWTNTWAGTHEAQYIGGVNQNILPANAYIERIVGVVAGATIEDIIIGDGSDTDRFVEITTGLAAGTVSFAIANPTSDGTNRKMVVDPDANFTGSITWTITGRILEA